MWLQAAQYMADIHNVTADETLDWNTPWSKRRCATPDISAFLQYQFWEPVFYHDHTEKFPKTKEKCGRWLGVAHNIGDAMTFKVLAENNQILERSVIRSARDPERPNKTVQATEESDNSSEPEHILDSKPPPQLPHKARTKPIGNRKQERRGVRRPNTVEGGRLSQ